MKQYENFYALSCEALQRAPAKFASPVPWQTYLVILIEISSNLFSSE